MTYPALDVRGADPDIVLAVVDDFAPTAVEDIADGVSIFFTSAAMRDAAAQAVTAACAGARVQPREVDDGDWARRSQQGLTPVTVGRVTVSPPWSVDGADGHFAGRAVGSPADAATVTASVASVDRVVPNAAVHSVSDAPVLVVITPSMGFGTGHHATTRLCLAALQSLDVYGRSVLDVGTGSGVLAITSALLGAASVLGIDFDADAITSATENRDLNPGAAHVHLEVCDLRDARVAPADIVLANLTGATVVANANGLRASVAAGGHLIVSGVQVHEREEVLAAFAPQEPTRSDEEAGWVGLTYRF